MNAEIQTEWAAALRSGKYAQGKNRLRSSGDKFCCLGVLCEIAVDHGVISPATRDSETEMFSYQDDTEVYDAWLPLAVRAWAGLESDVFDAVDNNDEPILVSGVRYACLSGANDMGETFADIADFIESVPSDS